MVFVIIRKPISGFRVEVLMLNNYVQHIFAFQYESYGSMRFKYPIGNWFYRSYQDMS